jgi:curved DNA-binding protein CbpA
MAQRGDDPYQVLGVSSRVSDDELRAAYRRLVQLHHPDHNGGSADAARRFEAVQEAYAQVRRLRSRAPRSAQPPRDTQAPGRSATDPNVEARLADLERELRDAQAGRERVRRAAREAAEHTAERPSDEDLGYVTTNDSFAKILADARAELSDRFSEVREAARREAARREAARRAGGR